MVQHALRRNCAISHEPQNHSRTASVWSKILVHPHRQRSVRTVREPAVHSEYPNLNTDGRGGNFLPILISTLGHQIRQLMVNLPRQLLDIMLRQ